MTKSESQSRHADPVLPIAAAWAIVGFVAAVLPLRHWDYWYHLTVGRLLATHGALPDKNVFGFSAEPSVPLFLYTWIGDQWMYELHEVGGLVANLAVRNLSAMAAWGMIAWCVYRLSDRHVAATAGAVLGGGLSFLAVAGFAGPAMFVWPLFAVLAVLFVQSATWERRGLALVVVSVIVASAFWANTSSGFWAPAALCLGFGVAAHLQGKPRHRNWYLGAALLSVATITICTPHGPRIYRGLLEYAGIQAWFVLGAPLLLAPLFGILPRWAPTLPVWPARGLALFLALAALAAQPWSDAHRALPAAVYGDAVRQQDPLRGYGPANTPVEAVEILRTWGSQPRIYATGHLSGYLLYELQDAESPQRIVWQVPDRVGADDAAETERAIAADPEVCRGVFHQLGVKAVLVTPEIAEVGKHIEEAPDWVEVGSWPSGTLYALERR